MRTISLLAALAIAHAAGACDACNTLRPLIKRHEGLRLSPYRCTRGAWTIGYGHKLTADDTFKPISKPYAEDLLTRDLHRAHEAAMTLVPDLDSHPLSVQHVLISMCFQLGATGTAAFKHMLRAVHARDYGTAADEMHRSLWALQTPERVGALAWLMARAS